MRLISKILIVINVILIIAHLIAIAYYYNTAISNFILLPFWGLIEVILFFVNVKYIKDNVNKIGISTISILLYVPFIPVICFSITLLFYYLTSLIINF